MLTITIDTMKLFEFMALIAIGYSVIYGVDTLIDALKLRMGK